MTLSVRAICGILLSVIIVAAGVYYICQREENAPFISSSLNKPIYMHASSFTLTSTAFSENGSIPKQFTCDGAKTHPPLTISGAPEGTETFVLIMDDSDVPTAVLTSGRFLHWVVFNIPADTHTIAEGEHVGVMGANERGVAAYAPPCPPPQYEPSTHRYRFELFALNTRLQLPEGASEDAVRTAMTGHIITETTLTGLYSRI